MPDDPAVYCYFPSQLDPSLAPGRRNAYLHDVLALLPIGHSAGQAQRNEEPLRGTDAESDREGGTRLPRLIMDQVVFTQQYFEKTFGATEGDFALGLLHPGQMFGDRPVPGWSNYETPLENLFMAGAACHPGPGVTCLPGLNGARVVKARAGRPDGEGARVGSRLAAWRSHDRLLHDSRI